MYRKENIMNKIFLALALTATLFSAEGEKPELPQDVNQKMEEIHQLREQHKAQMELKIGELKVILQKYPELKERFEKRIEHRQERREERKEHRQERRENKQ
jgi:hypothetical protein